MELEEIKMKKQISKTNRAKNSLIDKEMSKVLKEVKNEEISKQVIRNIIEWSCDDKSEKTIQKYLSMTESEWNRFVNRFPSIVGAMAKGKAFAEMNVASNMYEIAMGGKKVFKQVAVKVNDFEVKEFTNNKGELDFRSVKVGEHYETKDIWEEQSPSFVATKFILENKNQQEFGKVKKEVDQNEYKNKIDNMDEKEKDRLYFTLKTNYDKNKGKA